MIAASVRRTLLSPVLRRTGLRTTSAVRPLSAARNSTYLTPRQPTATRAFSTTPQMSGTEGKRGVHNLEAYVHDSQPPGPAYSHVAKALQGMLTPHRKKDFDAAMSEKDILMVLDCMATWYAPFPNTFNLET